MLNVNQMTLNYGKEKKRMTILTDVLAFLPTTTEDVTSNDAFKKNIILHIQTALSTLHQNGVGTQVDIFDDDTIEWQTFFGEQFDNKLGQAQAKQYVYLKVQLLFDTPQPGTVTIMEKAMDEALWRSRLEFDIEDTT